MKRSRKQHINYSKRTAVAPLRRCKGKGGINAVLNQFMTALEGHKETRNHAGISLCRRMLKFGMFDSESQVKSFIEGFR